jgi:Rieske 2Fe-2S family protein
MMNFAAIPQLLAQARPGFTLPQALYMSEEAYAFDTQVMLKSVWLYACTVAHVKNPGDYYVFDLGANSVIILRGRDGVVRAFYNTCTHRGSQLCSQQRGTMARVMCPYHFWTFGLDGKLIAAREMPEAFDKSANNLRGVALENIAGLLFVCLSDNPPPIDRAKADIAEQVGVFDLEKMKVAVQDELVDAANWKLVMENNRECYHCNSNHPELLCSLDGNGFGKDPTAEEEAVTAAEYAHWQDLGLKPELVEFPDNWWHRVARLPLAHGAVSQTLDGQLACKRLIGPFTQPESTSLSVWTQPNSWHHFCCDHVVSFSLTPLAPDRTMVRTSWLVHEDAVEGVDYDIDNLTAVWRATNQQDRHLAEINHQGIATDGYRQGMYSNEEKLVEYFNNFYVERSGEALVEQTRS